MLPEPVRIGYVLKVFPRLSETFILNEVLAHERAGRALELFSLRPPPAGPVHEAVGRVRSPVTYIEHAAITLGAYDRAFARARDELPWFGPRLAESPEAELRTAYQAVEIALEARRRGVGHLHAHFASAAAGVARMAARFAGIGFSVTAHAKDIFHESVAPSELRGGLTDASLVVTVSDYNAEFLSSVAPAARIERVRNGVELEHFPFSDPGERPALIAGVGRLVEKKGFEDLVSACSLLARRGRRFECRIAGGGELEDALGRQVAHLGLEDRVKFLGPPHTAGGDRAHPRRGGARGALRRRSGREPRRPADGAARGDGARHPVCIDAGHGHPRARKGRQRRPARPQLRRRLARPARAVVEREHDVDRIAARLRSLLDASACADDDDPIPEGRHNGHSRRVPVG